jgi:hypothetical protein
MSILDSTLRRFVFMYATGYTVARLIIAVLTSNFPWALWGMALLPIAIAYLKNQLFIREDWKSIFSPSMRLPLFFFVVGYFLCPFGVRCFEVFGQYVDFALITAFMSVNIYLGEPVFSKTFGVRDDQEPLEEVDEQ